MFDQIRRLRRRISGQPSLDEQLTSTNLRARFAAQGVTVGLFSYGCFDTSRFPAGTTVGRYCSFAPTSQVYLRNHGTNFLGLTAYFYNERLGVVSETSVPPRTLVISDDVWIGHNAVILPQVGQIGRGAVIAAGAVVTRSVPAYAMVAGNPARILRYRFNEATIAAIEETRWWLKTPDELRDLVLVHPQLVFDPARHFDKENRAAPDGP